MVRFFGQCSFTPQSSELPLSRRPSERPKHLDFNSLRDF